MTVVGLAVTALGFGLLLRRLAMFMQFPADLDRVQALGHQNRHPLGLVLVMARPGRRHRGGVNRHSYGASQAEVMHRPGWVIPSATERRRLRVLVLVDLVRWLVDARGDHCVGVSG